MKYYTYAHQKPDGKIFYIGKGKGMRYKSAASGRSKYWHEIAKDGFEAKILAYWPTEDEALQHEIFLISCFKDMKVSLVNRTTGGQRGTHAPITEETRLKMVRGQQRINARRAIDSEWDAKIHKARSDATKKRTEGYQKEVGIAFTEKIKANPEYAKRISISRKIANTQSIVNRYARMADKVKKVREMRAEGFVYRDISKITGFSISVISNILLKKSYVGVGEF